MTQRLLSFFVFVLFIFPGFALAEETESSEPKHPTGKIVIWPFDTVGEATDSDAMIVYNAIIQYIEKEDERKAFSILDNSDTNSAPIEDMDKADCKGGRKQQCGFTHAKLFGADTLVTGQLGHTGNIWILSLERINVATKNTEASVNRMTEGEFHQLLKELPTIAEDLFKTYQRPQKQIPAIATNTDTAKANTENGAPSTEQGLLDKFNNEETQEDENAAVKEKDEEESSDPKRLRKDLMIFLPTAQPLDIGSYAVDFIYAGLIDFTYQFTPNLKAGVTSNIPVGYMGAMPHLTLSLQTSENSWIGFEVNAFFVGTFDVFGNNHLYGFYGGPIYTIGTDRYTVNFALRFFGAASGDDWLKGALMLASVGGTYQLTDILGFSIDLTIPYYISDEASNPENFTVICLYGLILQGKIAYGNIGFAGILAKYWFNDGPARFFPLGIPYFRFGFMFD